MEKEIQKNFIDKEKKISKKFNYNKNYDYKISIDNQDNHIIELYNNDELIMKAEYELIGIYNIYNSIWYWAWNIQMVDHKLITESQKIKKFVNIIKDNFKKWDPKKAEEYNYICKNGNFYTTPNKLLMMVKLILYITNGIWYIPICHNKKNSICYELNNYNLDASEIKSVEYLLIKKIIYFR